MQLLMCAPSYYGIEYEINPWMSRARQSDPQGAQEQWNLLCRILSKELSVEILLIDPKPGLPDMVFTANGGLVWNDRFIASNFRHEVRRRETPYFTEWFRKQGFEIVHLPMEYYFEGEGDLLKCGELWCAGYHIRSDLLAHQKVAEIIEDEILSLELTNDWYYHLDTCFCPLSDEHVLFYPPAFDSYGLEVLEKHIPDLIPVAPEEAARFACNAIVVDRDIVMNTGCPGVREKLEALGFRVFETPLDEFIKAGGSAKCLVLCIH